MAFIHDLHSQQGLLVRPGREHFCPICNQPRMRIFLKRDDTFAGCFKCGHCFVPWKRGPEPLGDLHVIVVIILGQYRFLSSLLDLAS